MHPHQANLQPNLLYFNPTPTILGVTFDCTLSFSKHVLLLKAKFFPCLKALRCISASSWGPSKVSLSLLYKAFFDPLSLTLHPDGFLFLSLLISPNWNASTGWLVMPSPAAYRPLLSHFSSLRLHYPPSPLVTLTHFAVSSYEWALCLPTSFPISGLATLEVKPRLCRSSWRVFASTHSLMLLLLLRLSLLSSSCSRFGPLSLAKVQLSLTLTLSHLTIWCSGQTALFPFLLAKATLAYLPTALSVALRPLFPFQQAQYVQVFSSLLLLSDSHVVLATLSSPPSFLLPQTLWQIW